MAVITKMEEMPRKKNRRLIELDEEAAGSLHKATVREAGLTEGMELSENAWRSLLLGPELRMAKEAALHSLGRRARTRQELIRYLRTCGYQTETAEAAAAAMEDYGYVNDGETAAAMVRSGAQAGKGRRELAQRMRLRGIDPETAQACLQDYTEDMEEEAAAGLAAGYWRRYAGEEPRKRRDKTAQALLRRGFSWQVIEPVLRRLEDQEEF